MRHPDPAKLLSLLQARFTQNMQRHAGLDWAQVQARLQGRADLLQALQAMEDTGGEPDVVGRSPDGGGIVFCDCAAESPAGRRSLCFDRAALDARKENKPAGSVVETAAAMGIALLTDAQYRALQGLGAFDSKTSSWVATPPDMRRQGGALFCDRRYGSVFTYHNGAQSYYASRGFRGALQC